MSWSNGKLTQIVCNGNEDGEKYTDTATFEYGDNTYPNITKQWTDNYMADIIEDMEFLFYVGYFGVAGDYHLCLLPSMRVMAKLLLSGIATNLMTMVP